IAPPCSRASWSSMCPTGTRRNRTAASSRRPASRGSRTFSRDNSGGGRMASLITEIVLAGPRGFCAGVERAIDIVELALAVCGPPVYVRKEIVHNRHVVETLRTQGAIFVDELDEVPDDA